MMKSAAAILETINWDFVNAPPNRGIHAIHPYPAKFINEIPKYLIELFHPGDSSPILDPFCGSGTTLVESISVGIDAWGIDLHPLACLISRVKTHPVPDAMIIHLETVLSSGKHLFSRDKVEIPAIPKLEHWFMPDIQKSLAALMTAMREVHPAEAREILEVALSSIIVRVSNQESDTRYAAVKKKVTASNVFEFFHRAALGVIHALTDFRHNLFQNFGVARVINKDLLEVSSTELPDNFGLVITSPPYPNAYEYWLYHKYRMFWLGMDPLAVRRKEIGARPHYFKTVPQDERDFERQMMSCFKLLSQVMHVGARACFLVGRSIIHGRKIDNVALLRRASESKGFSFEGATPRQIPSTRKTFNPRHGNINQEHIMVFRLKCKP